MSGPEGTSSGTLPEQQVRAMFDRIAGKYDLMNSVMTAGLHDRWRARAVDLAELEPGDRALDVATGTGDLALELSKAVGTKGEVIASDFAEQMLEVAREKQGKTNAYNICFEWANAMELPYEDDEFAAVTVGFGVRNFSDLDRGLSELVRVVRPGGKVVILEISTPTRPPLSFFYRAWFDRLVPMLGKIGGEDSAYSYLPSSVKRFPDPRELAAKLARAGTADVRYVSTAGGIIVTHHARVV